jgi:hypothetical protein
VVYVRLPFRALARRADGPSVAEFAVPVTAPEPPWMAGKRPSDSWASIRPLSASSETQEARHWATARFRSRIKDSLPIW